MGLQLFFISRLFMLRFANGFQQNDGNTLLSTVLMSYKAQIYFFYLHVENHCLSPCFCKPIYLFWEISEFQKLITPR